MDYTDDKTNFNEPKRADTGIANVKTDADSSIMPKVVPTKRPPEPQPEKDEPTLSFAAELVAVTVKAVAVALSVVIILLCILAVTLPLQTMRVFNTLGMSARSVDFGERYISKRLHEIDGKTTASKGAYTDKDGNFPNIRQTSSLTDADFTEALYVCVNLSDRLMNDSYAAGNSETGAYYAERLEKYTRMYLSLRDVSVISAEKNKYNIASMPSPALHPAVYSYEHDMRVLNYRARAYLGMTDYIAYNPGSNDRGVIKNTIDQSWSLYGAIPNEDNIAPQLDDFVDFVDQIGEYLDVQFLLAGVENVLSKKVDIVNGDNYTADVPIVSEMAVKNLYSGKLKGNEFSLLVVGHDSVTDMSSGFTVLYDRLKVFGKYAQWAVDFTPRYADPREEMLHQLYWLRALSSAAQRLWYAEMLMYYNSSAFGKSGNAIVSEYGNCQTYSQVEYDGQQYQIVEVYRLKLEQYVAAYKSGATV